MWYHQFGLGSIGGCRSCIFNQKWVPTFKHTLVSWANTLACRQKLDQRVGCATLAAGEGEKVEKWPTRGHDWRLMFKQKGKWWATGGKESKTRWINKLKQTFPSWMQRGSLRWKLSWALLLTGRRYWFYSAFCVVSKRTRRRVLFAWVMTWGGEVESITTRARRRTVTFTAEISSLTFVFISQ